MIYVKRIFDAEQFHPQTKPWPDGVEQYVEKTTESVGGDQCVVSDREFQDKYDKVTNDE